MLRTISFFCIFWIYQILVAPLLLIVLIFRATGRDRLARVWGGWVADKWARILMGIAGARVERTGHVDLPAEQPVLFVSNHQGAFDIPLCISQIPRPIGFMAKKELSRLPSIGSWMKAMGCIFVDRGNRRLAMQSLQEACDALKSGVSLVVFPEGTRSNGDEMKTFKAGFARMALRAEVPIVPVVMKRTYRLKLGDQPWITAADVEVAIENPISIEEMRDMNVHEIARRVQEVIQRRLDMEPCGSPRLLEPSKNPV